MRALILLGLIVTCQVLSAQIVITSVTVSPSANILPGSVVTFDVHTTGETPTLFTFNFDDGTGNILVSTSSITHVFQDADMYQVIIGATDTKTSDTDILIVSVKPLKPVLSLEYGSMIYGETFSVSLSATGGQPVSFSVTGLTEAGFKFTGGTITGFLNDFHPRTVTISAMNSNGSDTETLTIQAFPKPATGAITISKGAFKRNPLKDKSDSLSLSIVGENLLLARMPKHVFPDFARNLKPRAEVYFGKYPLGSFALDEKGENKTSPFKVKYDAARGVFALTMSKGDLGYLDSDPDVDFSLAGHAKFRCDLRWSCTSSGGTHSLGSHAAIGIFKIKNKLTAFDSGKLVGSRAP